MITDKQITLVEKQLKKKAGAYTVGDIAASTGLPMLESRYALESLMAKYKSRLEVSEQGDLLYDFGSSLWRRGDKTFNERFNQFLGFLWKGFTIVYKAMIAVVLVVYFIAFFVILVGLVIATMFAGDGDGDGGGGFDMIGDIFVSIFRFDTHDRRRTYRPRDKWGYPYEHYEPRKTHLPQMKRKVAPGANPKIAKQKEKSFIASVYDFVFGPPRVDIDPLDNQKEVAAFLKDANGVVSVSELQALAGWKREEASSFLTECITAYNGSAEINEDGVLYGSFEEVLRSGTNEVRDTKIEYFWDEYVPEYELTGNDGTKNFMIIGMNTFNLGFSGYMLFAQPIEFYLAAAFLGWFPLVYSVIFFFIPFVRSFQIKKKQQEQHEENIRKRLMEAVFKKDKDQLSLQELTQVANNIRTTEEKLSEPQVKKVLDDFIIDIGGEACVDADGEVVFDFHQLNIEVDSLKKIRSDNLIDTTVAKRLELGYLDDSEEKE